MNEIEPGKSLRTKKSWDWSDPQIILATLAIVCGLLGSVFGVALALPFGQDLLCKSINLSCPHFKVSDARFSILAIDFDGWCKSWISDMNADPAPPPGFSGSESDCALDFSQSSPPGFAGPIETSGVPASPGIVLVGHFQMQHPAQKVDTPFTLRLQCWRHDPAIQLWGRVPCEMSEPTFGAGNPLSGYGADADSARGAKGDIPAGVLKLNLAKDELDFIARWRLDLDGQTTANVAPGDYRVELAIGDPGEAIDDAPRVQAAFSVFPPP